MATSLRPAGRSRRTRRTAEAWRPASSTRPAGRSPSRHRRHPTRENRASPRPLSLGLRPALTNAWRACGRCGAPWLLTLSTNGRTNPRRRGKRTLTTNFHSTTTIWIITPGFPIVPPDLDSCARSTATAPLKRRSHRHDVIRVPSMYAAASLAPRRRRGRRPRYCVSPAGTTELDEDRPAESEPTGGTSTDTSGSQRIPSRARHVPQIAGRRTCPIELSPQ
jgi:hypothetical protein